MFQCKHSPNTIHLKKTNWSPWHVFKFMSFSSFFFIIIISLCALFAIGSIITTACTHTAIDDNTVVAVCSHVWFWCFQISTLLQWHLSVVFMCVSNCVDVFVYVCHQAYSHCMKKTFEATALANKNTGRCHRFIVLLVLWELFAYLQFIYYLLHFFYGIWRSFLRFYVVVVVTVWFAVRSDSLGYSEIWNTWRFY